MTATANSAAPTTYARLRATSSRLALLLALAVLSCSLALGSAVSLPDSAAAAAAANQQHMLQFDAPAYRVISDEDRSLMQHVRNQIDSDFANFKDLDEVHKFLDKVKLLVQKHPKNVAFASGDLKELHKFLSQEIVTRLIRLDTMPFEVPVNDERMLFAQRAVDEDELTSRLFGASLRSLVEAKKQNLTRAEEGNHRDGNFFSNFWCKISGNCGSN